MVVLQSFCELTTALAQKQEHAVYRSLCFMNAFGILQLSLRTEVHLSRGLLVPIPEDLESGRAGESY